MEFLSSILLTGLNVNMNLKNIISNLLRNYLHIRITKLKKDYRSKGDRYYTYQSKYINFQIKKGDKVLDIGSGGFPFPYATHLADNFPGLTSHRFEHLKKDDRPFVVCNIESTPFSDNEFDFVYCSHSLEHVTNPGKACRELMRVAKRGYIETPTKISDVMFNFTRLKDHHKWYVEARNNFLFFFKWKESERRNLGTDFFFYEYHSEWENPFQNFVYTNRDLFVNMFLWNKSFGFMVIDESGNIIDRS